jgi:hypothetical protein
VAPVFAQVAWWIGRKVLAKLHHLPYYL